MLFDVVAHAHTIAVLHVVCLTDTYCATDDVHHLALIMEDSCGDEGGGRGGFPHNNQQQSN